MGYLNAPKWSGKSLVPDPERAPLIARAFEDLATGRFTKQEVIARMTEAGLRTRRGLVLSPQSFGQMVRNSIYVGRVESPDYGVSTRGDFERLIDEATFYRVQAVLDGRVVVAGPRPRNHPDFPLRGFVRCETCSRPLTGSWSKGRNGHYAYYHCQPQCRAVTRIAFQACSFNHSDTVPSIPLGRSASAGTRCGPTQERHLAQPQPFRRPLHNGCTSAKQHDMFTAVRSTAWVGDFSRVESTTWRWWPRFVPDGTH
jgi:hypothetical protein